MKKMHKYVNGDYDFLWAYRNFEPFVWGMCNVNYIHFMTKFSIPSLVNFYNAQENFRAISFLSPDNLLWYSTSCPDFPTNLTAFYKARAYEILGRMCHLLEDMSVPCHAHCTAHAGITGMYYDLYEKHVADTSTYDYHWWTAQEIWDRGERFINPFNEIGDPIYFLMYFMNQIADHYADGKKSGDDNYDPSIPGLSEVIPLLGAPTIPDEINDTNCRLMHDVLMPFAIRTTAGLLYWFAIESGTLQDNPPSTPVDFTSSWSNNHPKIYWTANTESDFDHYEIWKKRGSGSWFLRTTTTATNWVDEQEYKYTYPATKEYIYYRICAVDNANQKSGFTAEKSFTVNAPLEKSNPADSGTVALSNIAPETLMLYQPAPNPFNQSTTIRFALPSAIPVDLIVFDLKGKVVRKLITNEYYPPNYHSIVWDGRNDAGITVASGLYLILFKTSERIFQQKLLLLK